MNRQKVLQVILIFIFVLMALPVSAQSDPDPVPLPDGQPTPDHTVIQQMYDDYHSQFADRTLADYRVVYLIAEDALSASDLVSSDSMLEIAPTLLIAHDWNQVLLFNAEAPIQGLVIHASALPWIDTAWTQTAYANGMGMVGIDTTFGQFAGVTGDYCEFVKVTPEVVDANAFTWSSQYNSATGHTVMASYWVAYPAIWIDPAIQINKVAIADEELRNCKQSKTFQYGLSSGGYNHLIDTPETLNEFAKIMLASVAMVEVASGKGQVQVQIRNYVESFNATQQVGE